jgi:hypothetical protein
VICGRGWGFWVVGGKRADTCPFGAQGAAGNCSALHVGNLISSIRKGGGDVGAVVVLVAAVGVGVAGLKT